MTPSESQIQKQAGAAPLGARLAEEIERALAMMQRVRTAQAVQGKGEVLETPGNRYELPEPPVLRVSGSTEGD